MMKIRKNRQIQNNIMPTADINKKRDQSILAYDNARPDQSQNSHKYY